MSYSVAKMSLVPASTHRFLSQEWKLDLPETLECAVFHQFHTTLSYATYFTEIPLVSASRCELEVDKFDSDNDDVERFVWQQPVSARLAALTRCSHPTTNHDPKLSPKGTST